MNAQEEDRFADTVADIAEGRDTVDQLEQDKYTHPAIPVRITEPVPVQSLPFLSGASRNINIGDSVPATKILNEDDRRARALVVSDVAFYIGTDKTAVEQAASALWPALEPLEIRTIDAWYARTETGTGNISIINDQWAE